MRRARARAQEALVKTGLAVALALLVAAPAARADVAEPKTGVAFAEKQGDLRLLGVGLRTKTMLKVKVYAIALYAAESAGLKAKSGTALYDDLIWGDYPKEIRMKFVRDVSSEQIRDAFAESLGGADSKRRQDFLAYFTEIKSGQEIVLRWAPGGTLETTVAGQSKPPIADKNFAATVFAIWLGASPIQEDIKRDLVARK
jgi:hypothetical protein